MKRLAIFAFYNEKGFINDYVVTYLKYLKEVCDSIIFVADNEPDVKELGKIYPLVSHIESYRHGEYDFGSYKIGYKYAEDHYLLEDTDELILCNDSCFCVDSLKTVFDKMSKSCSDFWAMTASNEYEPHLQSFFLVIKKNLFNSDVFTCYLENVKHLESFLEIVNTYEIPLKKNFESKGFKGNSFIKAPKKYNPTFFPTKCLKAGMPLIKRKIFTESYACRESLLKVILELKLYHKQSYKEILRFYNVKSLLNVWYRFFKPKVHRAIFRIDVSSRGNAKVRLLSIPIFFYRKEIKK